MATAHPQVLIKAASYGSTRFILNACQIWSFRVQSWQAVATDSLSHLTEMMLAVLPDEQAPWSMKSAHSAQTHSGGWQIDGWLWIPLLWIRDLCPEFIYYFAQWPLNLSASGNSISKHPANRFLSARLLPLSEHSAEKMKGMQQLPGKDPQFTRVICSLWFLKRIDSCQLFVSFLIRSFTLSLFPKICLWKCWSAFLGIN